MLSTIIALRKQSDRKIASNRPHPMDICANFVKTLSRGIAVLSIDHTPYMNNHIFSLLLISQQVLLKGRVQIFWCSWEGWDGFFLKIALDILAIGLKKSFSGILLIRHITMIPYCWNLYLLTVTKVWWKIQTNALQKIHQENSYPRLTYWWHHNSTLFTFQSKFSITSRQLWKK